MGIKIITPPTAEPVTLELAHSHLRLDSYDSPATHPDDTLIEGLISAAREWAENFTGRALAPQTIELALDEFPDSSGDIELPMPPLDEIVSVTYVDDDGNAATMETTDYTIDTYQEPSWLQPVRETDWPGTDAVVNAVKVRYAAGYSAPADSPQTRPLPKSIRAAILLVLGHLYENRENSIESNLADIPLGAESLLRPYRVLKAMA